MALDPVGARQHLHDWIASGRPDGRSAEQRAAAGFPTGCVIRGFFGAPLFHSTCEPFDPAGLRPGGDGLLWTAEDSATSQTYIPAQGLWMPYSRQEWDRNSVFRPQRNLEPIWRAMGLELGAQTRFDRLGRAECFHWSNRKDPMPTMGEVYDFLDTAGYRDGDHGYRLPLRRDKAGTGWELAPADYRTPGRLFVLCASRRLELLDISRSSGGDLLDLDYHKHGLFKSARGAGLDGVLIRDYCQSRNWGNVGHASIGLFEGGLAACGWDHIPAVNFDWPPRPAPEMGESPEFARLVQSMPAGFPTSRGDLAASRGAPAREGR